MPSVYRDGRDETRHTRTTPYILASYTTPPYIYTKPNKQKPRAPSLGLTCTHSTTPYRLYQAPSPPNHIHAHMSPPHRLSADCRRTVVGVELRLVDAVDEHGRAELLQHDVGRPQVPPPASGCWCVCGGGDGRGYMGMGLNQSNPARSPTTTTTNPKKGTTLTGPARSRRACAGGR